MASTLTKILVHITFSTKGRAPLITEAHQKDLYAFIGGICRRMDSPLLDRGGVADHVHLLVSFSKSLALSNLMMEIKRDSSKLMKDLIGPNFAWQDGYFAFSIAANGVDPLSAYIANQAEHHRAEDFKDEMRTFMRRYGIEWDERYVLD